jgi:hypothetical protein
MTRRRLPYTRDSVQRALAVHTEHGLIRRWRPAGGDRYRAELVDGEELELRSLREAYVFVNGLATAHHAQLRAEARSASTTGAPTRPSGSTGTPRTVPASP